MQMRHIELNKPLRVCSERRNFASICKIFTRNNSIPKLSLKTRIDAKSYPALSSQRPRAPVSHIGSSSSIWSQSQNQQLKNEGSSISYGLNKGDANSTS